MTDAEIDRAIEDARQTSDEFFIRDDNGKVFKNLTSFPKTGGKNNFENSELDLASNLSSSTELEADNEHEEEKIIRRSKRLTETKISIRYNNPICHDYRKLRRMAELGSNNGSNGHGDEQPQNADNNSTSRTETHRDNHEYEDPLPVHKPIDHWRNYHHIEAKQNPIGRTAANSERGNVEDSDNLH